MHVLFLPSWYPKTPDDISGSFFREQAIALHHKGCKVGVIAPSVYRSRHKLHHDWRNIFKLKTPILIEDDQGVSTFREKGVSRFPHKIWRQARWLRLSLFEAYQHIHGRPDILHVHGTIYAGAIAADIQKKYGIPYVLSEHSSAFARGVVKKRMQRQARQWMQNAAARFAVSGPLASLLVEQLDFTPDSWQIVPNSVDEPFLRHPLNQKENQAFTFIHVSLLNENKRVERILYAFAAQFGGNTDIRLTIGGDGPLRGILEQLAYNLGIQPQVRFTGMLSRQGVLEEISRSDAFVLSSRYETFGVVLIEAMALGKPIIATRCGGPEDIVTDDVGHLVPPDDVMALADAMEDLYTHRTRYDSAQIRSLCEARYSTNTITQRWIEIYESIAQNSLP